MGTGGSAPRTLREVETKFDIPDGFQVPNLARFTPEDGRVALDHVTLTSTYSDTPAMRLLRFRVTLRRREAIGATDDVGWQLKVPGRGFRTELHWPLGDPGAPPSELLDLLHPFLDGVPVGPAVRLEVSRTRHRIVDNAEKLLAEIAHDEVTATELGAPVRAGHWREAEVELGPEGDDELLKDVGRLLRKAGARPSSSRSKLAHAVAGTGNESDSGPRRSAGAVLSHYVSAQVDAIVAGHFAIHEDAPDSVHQTRVACRRLRSALRTFAACYDEAAARTLGAELQWYAGVLGSVRDIEVMRQRLADHLADLPAKSVVGQVTEHIEARLARRQQSGRADILDAHTGTRYAALLTRLVDWRDDPPFTAAAGRPAATLAKSVRHADKVLIKRLKRATSAQGDDTEMHSARKAGKRARYADEVVPTGRSAKHDKQLQDLLGEFQDSIVASEVIDWLAHEARENGEDTFTYGVLFAAEHERADRARRRARGWARKS